MRVERWQCTEVYSNHVAHAFPERFLICCAHSKKLLLFLYTAVNRLVVLTYRTTPRYCPRIVAGIIKRCVTWLCSINVREPRALNSRP